MLTKLQISVIKVGVYARVCVCVCACVRVEGGSGSRSSQMFDISRVLAFAILFMYAEPRYIFTRCILLRMYIHIYIYTYIYAVRDEEKKTVELTRERG